MSAGSLHGVRVVVFEARRADELHRMLARHGADVLSAPAVREVPLEPAPEVRSLVERLRAGTLSALVLLTGVGTRALATMMAATCPDWKTLLGHTVLVARGPKPLAALRELGVASALPVERPHTWRETLAVLDGLAMPVGATVAVQEYGRSPTPLLMALEARGHDVLRLPVYRWALPDDVAPLERAVQALCDRQVDVAVFTSGVQADHAFRIATSEDALRDGLGRAIVASVGPMCSEALEAWGVDVALEASPPKIGPLVALLAERVPALLGEARAQP